MCVCVCLCVFVCARACACVRVCVCACVRVLQVIFIGLSAVTVPHMIVTELSQVGWVAPQNPNTQPLSLTEPECLNPKPD